MPDGPCTRYLENCIFRCTSLTLPACEPRRIEIRSLEVRGLYPHRRSPYPSACATGMRRPQYHDISARMGHTQCPRRFPSFGKPFHAPGFSVCGVEGGQTSVRAPRQYESNVASDYFTRWSRLNSRAMTLVRMTGLTYADRMQDEPWLQTRRPGFFHPSHSAAGISCKSWHRKYPEFDSKRVQYCVAPRRRVPFTKFSNYYYFLHSM